MVDSMNEYSDLPQLQAVHRLVEKTNDYVLSCLGSILGMPGPDVESVRFRLQTNADFIFYFRFNLLQRTRMVHMLRESISRNIHVARLTWVMFLNAPPLNNYPEFRKLFTDSLFCRLTCFLMPHGMTF